MSDDKTHPPTPKKLLDARKRSEVPKSGDVPQAAAFLAVAGLIAALGGHFYARFAQLFAAAWQALADPALQTSWALQLEQAFGSWLVMVLPVLGGACVAAVLAGFAQTRGLVAFELVKLKFEKLNPAQNLKNLFSTRQLFDLGVKLLKVLLLTAVIAGLLHSLLPALAKAAELPPVVLGSMLWKALMLMLAMACGVYLLLAAVDFGLQRFQFMRQQRMSFEEIKREHKDMEGDPHVKGQRRQRAQELLAQAGQGGIAGAKVLVTNPTHYAVALGYEPGRMDVPCVLDKGSDGEAYALRERARELGIPIFENVPLARDLHACVPVGSAIHERMFEPVAEVLAWVARLERRRQA